MMYNKNENYSEENKAYRSLKDIKQSLPESLSESVKKSMTSQSAISQLKRDYDEQWYAYYMDFAEILKKKLEIAPKYNKNNLERYYKNIESDVKNSYKMDKLIALWCEKSSINSKKILCRGYYNFSGIYDGYWNAYFVYDITTNKYEYILGSGNPASIDSPGLRDCELIQYIQIY